MKIKDFFLIIAAAVLLSSACQGRPPVPASARNAHSTVSEQRNKRQSRSVRQRKASTNEIIEYKGYKVSYNEEKRIPNWVFYVLLDSETDGPYSRNGKQFCPDPKFMGPQADDYDYKGSGWSRGHMAPAGDFKWSNQAMIETFYYTNCCPQDQSLNSGQWNTLEKKVRSWANRFGEVQVYTGPIIGDNKHGKIGSHGVIVPDAFFKAICTNKQTIAFVMYNHNNNGHLRNCAMSIDRLEELTGLDFTWGMDAKTENQIEQEYNLKYWGL